MTPLFPHPKSESQNRPTLRSKHVYMQNLYQDKHDPLCPERGPAEEEGGYNHNWKSEILLNTTGGGPRLDHRARLEFGRVHFGVFSMSRIVPPALSSHWA